MAIFDKNPENKMNALFNHEGKKFNCYEKQIKIINNKKTMVSPHLENSDGTRTGISGSFGINQGIIVVYFEITGIEFCLALKKIAMARFTVFPGEVIRRIKRAGIAGVEP